MIYLLDTNAWVVHLRQKSPALTQRLLQQQPGDVVLCSVVVAELHYGAIHSGPGRQAANLALLAKIRRDFVSLPFDDLAAEECGEIRQHLNQTGQPIGPNDLMIAAIARANELTLVTHNTAEFSRVPGLLIEDWQV